MLQFPECYEATRDEAERAAMRSKVERSLVQWTYEQGTKDTNPILYRLYNLWHGRTRQETVGFTANT